MIPQTKYTLSGDASIAYQVVGETGPDVLFLTGWIAQIEHLWEAPANQRFLERLGQFGRLIMFDSRGTGLSDRVLEQYTVEQEARDALAVLDAAGSERAAVLTYALGGLVGVQLAAEHPERVGALIMYASAARSSWAPGYEWALTVQEREEAADRALATWGEPNAEAMALWAPTMAEDRSLVQWFARLQRLAASPTEARIIARGVIDLDVRHLLAQIRV
ncbi:MAG: alpha/beta fold hydrolase, partial [Solirubrobacteraceae bacterium]